MLAQREAESRSRWLETMIPPFGKETVSGSAVRRQKLAAIALGDISVQRRALGDRMPSKHPFGWYSCEIGWCALSG